MDVAPPQFGKGKRQRINPKNRRNGIKNPVGFFEKTGKSESIFVVLHRDVVKLHEKYAKYCMICILKFKAICDIIK